MSNIKPTEIRLAKDKKTLHVTFNSGEEFSISAQLLRVESPSAEVQGHNPSQKVLVKNKENVEVMKIDPVGNYAVRITFDDMHDTGIYSWPVLERLGREGQALMAAYHEAVEAS